MTLCFRKFISSVGPGRFVLPMTDPSHEFKASYANATRSIRTSDTLPDPMTLIESTLRSSPRSLENMCFFVVPIGSMYGIHPYIWLIFMVNVGKYTIHGSYGFEAIDDETFHPIIHPSS